MMAQYYEGERGAASLAAAAVNEDPRDVVGRAPSIKMVQRILNQVRRRRRDSWSSRFNIVAGQDDLPVDPVRANFPREPRRAPLFHGNTFVAGMFDRDYDRVRCVVSFVGLNQLNDFGRFADRQLQMRHRFMLTSSDSADKGTW